jgi:hypothetical protein
MVASRIIFRRRRLAEKNSAKATYRGLIRGGGGSHVLGLSGTCSAQASRAYYVPVDAVRRKDVPILRSHQYLVSLGKLYMSLKAPKLQWLSASPACKKFENGARHMKIVNA